MFQFTAKQAIYDIAGVKIGGQHGELPTVLMPCIFYQGDANVIDGEQGIINEQTAKATIEESQRIAAMTGVPIILDVLGDSPRAMVNYIDFVAKQTNLPFLIDGTTEEVRLAGARYVVEHRIQSRAVYDSIGPSTSQKEIDELKELGLKTTIIIVLNNRKPTVQGRLEVVEGLIERAHQAGFDQLLLDTAVLDVVEPGPAGKTIFELKNRYGYPCGCSPTHTHRHRWKGSYRYSTLGQRAAKVSTATALQILGANFIMYGIKQTEVIPAMGMVDALIAYTAMQNGIKPRDKNHPLFKMFQS